MREVSCIGRCDIAPAATVQERPVAAAEVGDAVERARAGDDRRRVPRRPAAGPGPTIPTPTRAPDARYASRAGA